MKNKIAILLAVSAICSITARADVIWQDTFSYSNGPVAVTSTNVVNGVLVTNWFTHSGNNDCFVNSNRLEVSTSTANGGIGSGAVRSGDVHRFLSITNGSIYTNVQQVLYASFVVNFTNLPTVNGAYFAHFYINGTTFEGKLWALIGNPSQPTNNFAALPNTFRLGISAGTSGVSSALPNKVFPIDLALNTDYQVVLGWDPVTDDAISLWVNPISSSDVKVESNDSYVPTTANIAVGYAFRQASGFGGFLTASNVVIATTFNEAFTNVLATNAVAPKIVYQPVGNTNFVGAPVTLSAVAVGQGLASLTYQWFKGTTPFSNPAGNTNVLTFSSAQITDSANYTLVVTTPYGLSVTSSVATVSISAAPVPPSFITQPVSQTNYVRGSVTLSTSVSSPGNVTFTWYSNNVVVTDGVNTSGDSSSLALNNLTAFAATYKVAVTNDVVPNGIVSSNAIVTIVTPPAVSIAFLRKLVDPTTYQSTNSFLAFQITGTITTFTNLTTGNTSSYYLQDGTAGINIFATFGSTFRPAQGDVVTFVGVVSSFSSTLELDADTTGIPYTSYTDTGTTNALPTPIVIPFNITNDLNNANYNLAGSLVTLTNVFFGTNAGTVLPPATGTVDTTVTVTNSSGQTFNLLFPHLDADLASQTLPAFAYSVTGVLAGGNTSFNVDVTRFADIVTTAPVTPIPLTETFSGGTLTLNWGDPSFNLQSSTNVGGPYTTISGASSGFMTNTTSAPTMFFRLSHP